MDSRIRPELRCTLAGKLRLSQLIKNFTCSSSFRRKKMTRCTCFCYDLINSIGNLIKELIGISVSNKTPYHLISLERSVESYFKVEKTSSQKTSVDVD